MPPEHLNYARKMRSNPTHAEALLWTLLRSRAFSGFKFYRQFLIGPYIVDFCCRTAKIVVELDGGQHVDQRNYDRKQDAFLKAKGFHILRFWNDDVFLQLPNVLEAIFEALQRRPHLPSGHPLPKGRGTCN